MQKERKKNMMILMKRRLMESKMAISNNQLYKVLKNYVKHRRSLVEVHDPSK